jgi:hypothetical protein
MSTIDLSRDATDFRKHYAGVWMQQGRVLTDDDFNEAAALAAEDMRRTRLDSIGPYGSPDQGFQVTGAHVDGGHPQFNLSAGNLYLGGLHLELLGDEGFALQKNWLNFNADSDAPLLANTGLKRIDLVWIEAWQQPVTAVEDRELFEVALGGPDTSTRMRTMHRVHLLADVGTKVCDQAWTKALGQWSALGTLRDDMELASPARLKVTFTAPSDPGTLCTPGTTGDYLGAENQAIRVQTIDATHYTWGFDNAAPLYRALLKMEGGARIKLVLLTPPKDAQHWPLQGQVVELLPWSAALANGERVAELAGHLSHVATSYDPDTQSFTLATAPAATFNETWKTRSDQASFYTPHVINGDDVEQFVYVRVWNRGDDVASPAAIPLGNGTLGQTGLSVQFLGGAPQPGDHWIIAARPAAPDVITPWTLQKSTGAEPRGTRTYLAPLALIDWSPNTGPAIYDCRPPFQPLTRLRCCRELVVKPGPGWQRVFDQIPTHGDAVICFPPGHYPVDARITVANKGRLRLRGAGAASRIAGTGLDTLLQFQSCDAVDMRDLYIVGGRGHTTGLGAALSFLQVAHVDLHKVSVRCRPGRSRERACVRIEQPLGAQASRATVTECEFYVGHLQVGLILLNVLRVDVRCNRFVPSGPEVESIHQALRNKAFLHNVVLSSLIGPIQAPAGLPGNELLQIFFAKEEKAFFLTDEALRPFWRSLLSDKMSYMEVPVGNAAFVRIGLQYQLEKVLRSRTVRMRNEVLQRWLKVIDGSHAAVIGQAILVGGRQAEALLIESNTIDRAVQGIHVGLSHSTADRTAAGADRAGRVIIRQNYIQNSLCVGGTPEHHGIFVGNAQSTSILDNHLTLLRQPGIRHLPAEGIRVFGFLGGMLLVRGNHIEGFNTPIRTVERGPSVTPAVRSTTENYPL